MPATNNKLEGITLRVYLYVVRRGAPVGPREVMKGAHLSSPSVAYRHLEKLEESGLLQKNEFGEYVVKRKARIDGFFWFGKRLASNMLAYSALFLGIFAVELLILALHYAAETPEFKVFFLLMILITVAAMIVFLVESLVQHRRLRSSIIAEQTQD